MRACWAATILVLAQPSPVFCATYRGTSVVPRVLELTHRRPHKSPCVRQPFVETSGSIAFSSLCSFPGNCALFLCVSSRVHSIFRGVDRQDLHFYWGLREFVSNRAERSEGNNHEPYLSTQKRSHGCRCSKVYPGTSKLVTRTALAFKSLFGPQGLDRIDCRCPSRGQIARQKGRDRESARHSDVRKRVHGFHAEEQG